MKGSLLLSLFIIATGPFILCQDQDNSNQIWVYDFEEVLDSTQKRKLSDLYRNHEQKTSNEIILITTPSFEPDTSILFYSVNKLRELGIGKEGVDNGLLIVYSRTNRQVRITTGYGTENILKDVIAARIIDSLMIPYFLKNEAFEGLWKGSVAITSFLERPENKINSK